MAHKIMDHTSRDITITVDIYSTFAVCNQELGLADSEHTQRSQILNPVGDAGEVFLRLWGFRTQIGYGPCSFLVKGEDFDSSLGGDGNRTVKQVDTVTFRGDIKVVIVAEKFRLPTLGGKETTPTGCGLLQNGFKNLKILSIGVNQREEEKSLNPLKKGPTLKVDERPSRFL